MCSTRGYGDEGEENDAGYWIHGEGREIKFKCDDRIRLDLEFIPGEENVDVTERDIIIDFACRIHLIIASIHCVIFLHAELWIDRFDVDYVKLLYGNDANID